MRSRLDQHKSDMAQRQGWALKAGVHRPGRLMNPGLLRDWNDDQEADRRNGSKGERRVVPPKPNEFDSASEGIGLA